MLAGCVGGIRTRKPHQQIFTKVIGGESRNIMIAGEWKGSLDVTQVQAPVNWGNGAEVRKVPELSTRETRERSEKKWSFLPSRR